MELIRKMNFRSGVELVLYFGPYETREMILYLANQKFIFLANYSVGYALDPYEVLSPAGGVDEGHGYCMQLKMVAHDVCNRFGLAIC
jgi:hypothetical protein